MDKAPIFLHDPDESHRFIIFDMFGTLVRSRQRDMEDLYQVFFKLFPERTPEEVSEEYHRFYSYFNETHMRHSEMSIIHLIDHLNEVFGTEVDPLEAEEAMMRGTRMFIPIEGAEDTLRYFKDHGYRIGVLSNTAYRSTVVKGVLEDIAFEGIIDAVVTSAEVGYKKPSDMAYSAALKSIGAEKQYCFFAGDSCDKDCRGPLEFGFKGAFLIDPVHCGKRRNIVSKIGDIPSLFQE